MWNKSDWIYEHKLNFFLLKSPYPYENDGPQDYGGSNSGGSGGGSYANKNKAALVIIMKSIFINVYFILV